MGGRILENFTIDQLAGSTALMLGALGGLLTIIWKSRCLCRCRVGLSDKCYIFDCSREPPPPEAEVKDGEEKDSEDEENILPKTDSKIVEKKSIKESELTYVDEPLPSVDNDKP